MAGQVLNNLPNTSFGRDSVFERLLKLNARLCLIGVGLEHSVLFDFLEESAEVPWRYKKLFTGKAFRSGVSQRQGWVASVTNKINAEKISGNSKPMRIRGRGFTWSGSDRRGRNSFGGIVQTRRFSDIKTVG